MKFSNVGSKRMALGKYNYYLILVSTFMRTQYNIGSRDILRFIAGKSYYFGVGGGMWQFQNLIEEDAIFDVEIVWRNTEGIFLNKQ